MRTRTPAHKAVANGASMQGLCAHTPSGRSGPSLGARDSAQHLQTTAACRVCARDWRRAGGGGGSGSALRARGSVRGGGRCGRRHEFKQGIVRGEILLARLCLRRRPGGQGRRVGGGKGQGRGLGLGLWLRRGCGRGHAKGRAARGKGRRTRADCGGVQGSAARAGARKGGRS